MTALLILAAAILSAYAVSYLATPVVTLLLRSIDSHVRASKEGKRPDRAFAYYEVQIQPDPTQPKLRNHIAIVGVLMIVTVTVGVSRQTSPACVVRNHG